MTPSPLPQAQTSARVSVIIPVKDDALRLRRCLEALSRQTFAEPFEILVIDNGSSDSPERVIADFEGVRFLTEPSGGSYAARNAGLEQAHGEIIAFTDADCHPAPGWLEAGVRRLESAGRDTFVGGRIKLYTRNPERPKPAELWDLMHGLAQQRYVEEQDFAATANMFTWRAAFGRVGRFQQTFSSSGDREWGNRATAHGLRGLYAEEVVVDHPCRVSLKEARSKNRRMLRGDLELRRLNGRKLVTVRELAIAACPPVPTLLRMVPKVQPANVRSRLAYIWAALYVTYTRLFDRIRLLAGFETLRRHLSIPLYRNAYALIANTGLTAAFGAIYWIVAAHVYRPGTVGRGSALIAAMMLLSTVTQLNFVSVLIRFVPRAGNNSTRLILISYGLSAVCAVVVTSLVLGIAQLVSSPHGLLRMSALMATGFVLSTVIWSIFSLQDSALTGLRRTPWVPIENAIYGFVKILALFACVGVFGSSGLFASWTIPTLLALVPINWLIFRVVLPVHERATSADAQPLDARRIVRFMAGDYSAGLFAQATTTLLPVLVISTLGATAAAYFYIAQVIGTTLDRVSLSMSSSLTVEAARDENKATEYIRTVLGRGLVMVSCMSGFVILTAPWMLRVFGPQYSQHATTLLRLLALASVPRVFSMIYGSQARLQHKTHHIAYITFTQAVILVGGSLFLMPRVGIDGIGISALASQAVIVAVVGPRLLSIRPKSVVTLQPEV